MISNLPPKYESESRHQAWPLSRFSAARSILDAGPTPNKADRRMVSACTFKSDTTCAAFADLR